MALSLYQKSVTLQSIKLQVGILLLKNALILLVTDQDFRLGMINLTTPQISDSAKTKIDTIPLFSHSNEDTLISRMIGAYLSQKTGQPVLSVITVKAKDPQLIKEITTLIDDLVKTHDINKPSSK